MIGANKKKKVSEFATPYTVGNALTKGGATVKLSALVMGLANMAHKRIFLFLLYVKGSDFSCYRDCIYSIYG